MTSKTVKMSIETLKSSYGENVILDSIPEGSPGVKCSNGTFVGRISGEVATFRGIPFAMPPTCERRWKRPFPAADSDSIYSAYFNGKTPIQTEWESERASFYPTGEDCLKLNIWCSSNNRHEMRPVMVFFHGGSFGWGGTADPLYNGEAFVRSHPDIIMVCAGYRTGILGFIDFSEVEGGEDYPDAPNLGLYDQIEALSWIKRNISAFGGNPENITIFGESAGGASVSLLPFFPEAKGLFKRIISESGSVALTYSKEECLPFTRKLMKVCGAKNMHDLTSLTEEELIEFNEPINLDNNFPQRDGKVIPTDAYAPYCAGDISGIDIMIGTNANELNYWISELNGFIPFCIAARMLFKRDTKNMSEEDLAAAEKVSSPKGKMKIWGLADFYNDILFRLPALKQAEEHARHGGNSYVYYWDEPSAIPYRYSCHAVELAYVFGNINDTIYTGRMPEKYISDSVMDMWANFARCGNPSSGDIRWEKYSPESRETMILGKKPHMVKDHLNQRGKLLEPLLKYNLNGTTANLDDKLPLKDTLSALAEGILLAIGSIFK